jgi:hypothetical protein
MTPLQYAPAKPARSSQPLGDCHECRAADLVSLERTRWFARQIVGPDDLTQDQLYFRERHRRHNRLLHGWGIVCGARVQRAGGCKVVIEPGYVLGPHGDEILIGDQVTVDVCREDIAGNAVCDPPDPWCSDVHVRRPSRTPLYLAVRYCEQPSRPVRVMGCGCGCDDSECEYSRTRDGFEVKVLAELPDGYDDMSDGSGPPSVFDAFSCRGQRRGACPSCPRDPWVVLCDLYVEADDVVRLECDPHRRYVASFGSYWFTCSSKQAGGGKLPGHYLIPEVAMEADTQEGGPPEPTVPVMLGDQWVSVPGAFDVKRGDTIGTLLGRDGGKVYLDSRSGSSYNLSELYAAAGADPTAKVTSRSEALAPLEGRALDIEGLRVVRSGVDSLLDEVGVKQLDREHAGSPAAAEALPAVALKGVAADSAVGKRLAGSTVGGVAEQPLEEFVAAMTKNLKGGARQAAVRQAEAVHEAATRVSRLARRWGESIPG